jgi:hypothetical protein
MGKRNLALRRGGPKELRLRWRRGFRDFRVQLGDRFWTLDPMSLAAGASVQLSDGSSLVLRTERRRWWHVAFQDDVHVERNGAPLPGSDGDPCAIVRRASYVILFFALLRVIIAVLFANAPQMEDGAAVGVGAEGVVLLALGALAAAGRRLPLLLAAGVFAFDVVTSVVVEQQARGVLIALLVIAHLVRAWQRSKPRVDPQELAAVIE